MIYTHFLFLYALFINITTGGSGPPRPLGVRVYTSIILPLVRSNNKRENLNRCPNTALKHPRSSYYFMSYPKKKRDPLSALHSLRDPSAPSAWMELVDDSQRLVLPYFFR